MTRAADRLVETIRAHGLDRIFCVPGESYLSLLDALHGSDIDLVICRHEGGAGFMAVADARLTGRAGLAAVSRGPGATNASIAVHLADQDAVPLVLLVGQVARFERGRGAFQEVDYQQMFGGMAKGIWEVTEAERLSETFARAVHVAESGTPGPVILAMPEDMLGDMVSDPAVPILPVARASASHEDARKAADLLVKAERPLLVAGGQLDTPHGRAALSKAAEAHGIPVGLTFKYQHIFDNSHPLYAGHLGFKIPPMQVKEMQKADLIIAVGTRLGDTPTQGYQLPKAPVPEQPLIHVYPDADAIGRVFRTDLGIAADPASFLEALATLNSAVPDTRKDWAGKLNTVARKLADQAPKDWEDGIDFGSVVIALADQAPKDSIVITDSGNFSSWVHCHWPWDGIQTAIGAVGGAMGLAVPAAVAACLRHPDKRVIAYVGDGGVMMTGNELATAVSVGAKPVIVVSNNATYGTIRLHQEKGFPGRISGTGLTNPDFAAWGRAFGALGITISKGDDVASRIAEALAHDGPVVIQVNSSTEAISAYISISQIRAKA